MTELTLNLAIAGLVVGFMIGLTGVGSGALMAPVLLLLGIPPATVVGSDLLFGLLTKIVGVGSHLQRGTIAWRWVWLMAIGSVPGVLVGTRILAHFAGAPGTIRLLIGAVLVLTPVLAILMEIARRRDAHWVEHMRHPSGPAIAAIGGAIGVTVGVTSVGSGSLVDMALVLFSPLSGAVLIGTGIAHAVLITGAGAAAHWSLGNVDPALVGQLLIGSIPGVLVGGWVARRSKPSAIRWGATTLVLLSGLTLLSRA
ncbi:MAG TPA: sulfite exporter TauE/SafE family protein [Gemmatimonadaceae bacterium]|nr:sulfite exporter TauE/SafE family protein [Gemmatimonadaceae bacterium]